MTSIENLDDGDSFILGKCNTCTWQDVEIFTIGDEERDMACINLEQKHHETGCISSTVLLGSGTVPLKSFD